MLARRPLFRLGFLAFPLAVLLGIACGGSDGGTEPTPDNTRNLSKQTGDNQSVPVGTAVAILPSVKVTNKSGAGVAGVSITFAVATGGGAVTGATQTTDNSGTATVGGWTLGTTAGANTLTAGIAGGASVTFSATGQPGAAASATKQAGDNQTANTRANVPVRPAVKVTDQFNNLVAGVQVTFAVASGGGSVTGGTQTTGADGVATVGSWALGPTAGPNQLTATVAGITAPLTFSASGQETVIQPSQDTTLQGGTIQVTRLVIPAGRTVTVAGNLTLNVDSTVEIAGTLTGNCVAISLNGEQGVTVTGTISNACTTQPDNPPSLTLVAKGGYDLRTATLVTTGDVDITNDPTLTDGDFLPAASLAPRQAPVRAGGGAAVLCGVNSLTAPAARNGTNGKDGTNGRSGRTWTLRCRGDLSIGGTVAGQDGGNGGTGTDTQAGAASASGGNGGDGGNLRVKATGTIALGAGAVLRSGKGGNGGSATATAQESDAGDKAPSATATGGDGGEPGVVEVRGKNGIQVSAGAKIEVGRGGNGGDASATGADGKDATETKAAQDGGNATTTGGKGATVAVGKLTSSGNVLGGPAVTGGNGGNGGKASSTAGDGGDSQIESHPNGGAGGNINATGGAGGNAQAKNLAGATIGTGGNGGSAGFAKGHGGTGWDDCGEPKKPGGKGGAGGSAHGGDGAGGTGAVNGIPGGVTYLNVGNGGWGGDGQDPGSGGAAGTNSVIEKGAVESIDTNFTPGDPGAACSVLPEGKGALQFNADGIPVQLLPSIFGVIKQGATVITTVTQASQLLVLDPGLYTFEPAVVDPDGYQFLLSACANPGTAPAFPTSGPVRADGDPCGFTVTAGEILTRLFIFVATRGRVDIALAGLPQSAVAAVVLTSCISQVLCSGPVVNPMAPTSTFLAVGLWRLQLLQYVVIAGLLQNTYNPVVATQFLTVVGAQVSPVLAAYYLALVKLYFSATMAVALDPWGHAPFILMWATGQLQLIKQLLPPQASSGSIARTEGDPVPITITGPAPWVTVTGTLAADGTIVATGTGTVAGFPNVPVKFTGTLAQDGTLTGQYQMGQDTAPTGLPNGSITYNVSGAQVAPSGAPPRP
jgi:hypothetical protein